MTEDSKNLLALENRFWQAMVDGDNDTATSLLTEPALMVSPHGAFQFDHAAYRKMADQGPRVVTSFKLQDVKVVFPNDNTAPRPGCAWARAGSASCTPKRPWRPKRRTDRDPGPSPSSLRRQGPRASFSFGSPGSQPPLG